MLKLFSAFAIADFKSFSSNGLAAFGVRSKVASATSTGLFLIRSKTICTFLGEMRAFLKYA